MANLDNVRLFVIDSLKKYHQVLTAAIDEAQTTTLSDFLSKADAETTYLTKADAGNIYVAKVEGKGLSTEDYTTAEKTKLGTIAEGAEVNVNADWSAASGDAQILNKPNIAGLFGYAYYDTTNKRISFSYSSTSSELYNIDCSDFIIDGMIDNVSIEQYSADDQVENGISYLFINFNTAAETGGHTDIKIPLKNIFDPNNYYNKTTADSTFVKQGEETKLAMNSNAPGNVGTNHAKVISELTVSDHTITATYTDVLTGETSLSLGAAEGSGNVITSLSVNGHQITATYTQVFSADDEHTISLSGTKPASADNRTIVITDIVASGDKNHTLTLTYANVVTAETPLSMSGSAPTETGNGKAQVISQITVSDHTISATYTEVLTEHQSLSDYATKNYVGQTYLTLATAASTYVTKEYAGNTYVAKETGKGLSTNDFTTAYMEKLTSIEAGAQVNTIESITVNGGSAIAIDSNKNVNIEIPESPTISFAGTKDSDSGSYTYVANGFTASNHQITVSYTAVIKEHQDISGKEDNSNKKTSLADAANISNTYYPSTSAVATYVGSLAELTGTELEYIFGERASL